MKGFDIITHSGLVFIAYSPSRRRWSSLSWLICKTMIDLKSFMPRVVAIWESQKMHLCYLWSIFYSCFTSHLFYAELFFFGQSEILFYSELHIRPVHLKSTNDLWVIFLFWSVCFLGLRSIYIFFPLNDAGFIHEQQSMSVDVMRKAFQATEEGFLSVVTRQWPMSPQIAAVGSCCLVGVICNGTLYLANAGDSRAVLGRLVKSTGEVLAIQLSEEHNVAIESVRQELRSLHPDDPQIVVLKHNVWRVKGLIQVRLLWKGSALILASTDRFAYACTSYSTIAG